MRAFLIATAVFTMACSGAAAEDAPVVSGDDIVVTGDRLQEIVRSFVGEVSATSSSEDQLARWDDSLCPAIVGMRDRRLAQFMADRLAQRAFAVGLDVGGPNCRPNALIFVTPDSNQLAREIANEYREFIGYFANETSVTMGHEALTDFVETRRPVRWWHVSQTVGADGQVLGDAQTRQAAGGGFAGAQVLRGPDAGRLRATTRQDMSRVLIIVDASLSAGVQMDALADYVAMAALAQVALDADTREVPTILNLFAERDAGAAAPAGLTEWDMAYLRGLYEARRAARNSRAQEGDIVRTIEEELSQPPAAPTGD
jgi:hypothetical protein